MFEDASRALLGEEIVHVFAMSIEKNPLIHERLTFEDASRALLGKEIVHVFAMSIEKNPLIHMRD